VATFTQNILLLNVVSNSGENTNTGTYINYTCPVGRFAEISLSAITTSGTDTAGLNQLYLLINGRRVQDSDKLGGTNRTLESTFTITSGQTVAIEFQRITSATYVAWNLGAKEYANP
jgi:hypothetical protein